MKSNIEGQKEFYEIYAKEIVPIFHSHETCRKKELFRYLIYIIIAVLFCLSPLLTYFCLRWFDIFINPESVVAKFLAAILICLIISGMLMLIFKENRGNFFVLTLKKSCLPEILKIFGDVKWFNNKNIIKDSDLNCSGLFADFNHRVTDDEFQGTYKDVPFKVCETRLWYENSSVKNKVVIPVFKGVVISFQSNKEIKNRTIIATKGDMTKKNNFYVYALLLLVIMISIMAALTGDLIIWAGVLPAIAIGIFWTWQIIKNEEKLEEVKLEDPELCKKFNVYSSDQVEARYLLTTSFIKRFKNFKAAFKSQNVKCSFYGDQVMFAINTNKNLFEIGSLFKSLNSPKSVLEFYKELSSIYEMISYFKFDEKIGL